MFSSGVSEILKARGISLLAVVGIAAQLQGCVVSNSLEDAAPKSHSSNWVRADDAQDKIGQREHPIVVAKYGGEYKDKKVEKILAIVIGRLVAASDDKSHRFKITILNTPKVNAFALPGGYLYVTRGLLALANDMSEIAAVISHEMAHVSANHGYLRNQKKLSDDVGQAVVSEVLKDNIAGKVALAANQLRLAEFSKNQELQADAIGIRVLGRAGYNAHGAARFLETMQAYQSLQSKTKNRLGEISFLSSHPSTPQRVELAKRHARFFGSPDIGDKDQARFYDGINGLLYGDSAEEGFVRDNRFSHLGLGVTFNAPKTAKVKNQATAVVITNANDLATRFDAAVLPKGQSLEAYLQSGWVKGLDKSTIISGEINGLKSVSAMATGGPWQFIVKVIQIERQVYRFITAGPLNGQGLEQASREVADTFRMLTADEKSQLKPLRIKIVKVQAGDTLATLSSRMKGTQNKLRLFQILNELGTGEFPEIGSQVKIVSDG